MQIKTINKFNGYEARVTLNKICDILEIKGNQRTSENILKHLESISKQFNNLNCKSHV